ncbi:hypothetical protein PUN28_007464 [Cardiocondyla obscurior]|uniref:Uncharacterized protein n=1 Tax=Cardiocondyla obscurior TaxID=286306 RepID=A0AAW2G6B7_9HYME
MMKSIAAIPWLATSVFFTFLYRDYCRRLAQRRAEPARARRRGKFILPREGGRSQNSGDKIALALNRSAQRLSAFSAAIRMRFRARGNDR